MWLSAASALHLVKLWFFKLFMTKSNFEKISFDVISVKSSWLRHRKRH